MPYLTPEEIRNEHDAIYQGRQSIRPLPLRGRCVPIFQEFVLDPSSRVLEYGPGAGGFLRALAEKGYKNIYGCDIGNYIAKDTVPRLRGFAELDLSFDRLPWDDASFDAVAAWEVLEHVENPHHAIREAHRVLRPGGSFFISVPNIFHIVSRLVFLKRGVFPQWNESNNHISVFPHGIFEKTVLKYFDLIKEGFVYTVVQLPLLKHVSFFPENQWFGRWVYYVLKKK